MFTGYYLETAVDGDREVYSSLISAKITMTANDSCLITNYTVVGNVVQQAVVFYTIFHCDGSDTKTYYHHDTARTSTIIPVPAGECSIEYRALSSLYMGEDVIIRLTSIDVTQGNCSG